MIPRGLISCSKASRKASNSSADSVMSNGNFGRSVSSFVRRIFFAPMKLLSRAFMARLRTAAGESLLALQIKAYIVAVARVAEVDARRGGFGGQTASTRPKRRFVNFSRVCAPAAFG